jgi:hypothetical protein
VRISPSDENDHPSSAREDAQSVLANLPRARPQRSTPRRTAARKARAGAAAAEVEAAAAPERPAAGSSRASSKAPAGGGRQRKSKAVRGSAAKPRAAAGAKRSRGPAAARETIPRQGFECEGDGTRGSIQPPGASELVASAVEMVGELAKAGASRGERLLKDVLSRLSP